MQRTWGVDLQSRQPHLHAPSRAAPRSWRQQRRGASHAVPISSFLERSSSGISVEPARPQLAPAQSRTLNTEPTLLGHELLQGPLARYNRPSDRQPPTALLVHGILGNRRNLQGFARQILAGFPHWQVLLVDLRCHGDSAALGALPGPHSVASAAADVLRLLSALKLFPEVLIGHSFGGKVVLSMWEQFALHGRTPRMPKHVKAWVLDAIPGRDLEGMGGGGPAADTTAAASSLANNRPEDLIAAMRSTPMPARSRREVAEHLERAGFAPHVAAWAVMNLVDEGRGADAGQLVWGLDLEGIEEMYSSFKSSCHWDALARSAEGFSLNFVRAERSAFDWDATGCQDRIRLLGHGVHLLRGAGHWVHADNPQGLFELLAPSFGPQPDLRVQRSGWGGIPLSGEGAGAGGANAVLPFY